MVAKTVARKRKEPISVLIGLKILASLNGVAPSAWTLAQAIDPTPGAYQGKDCVGRMIALGYAKIADEYRKYRPLRFYPVVWTASGRSLWSRCKDRARG